jgi:hypothetical protein
VVVERKPHRFYEPKHIPDRQRFSDRELDLVTHHEQQPVQSTTEQSFIER